MKKYVILLLILFLQYSPGFASIGVDLTDFYCPLPYNGKMVDKMMVGFSTYKDITSSGTRFFDVTFLHFYMPFSSADLRIDGFIPDSGGKSINIATVIPLETASIKAGIRKTSSSTELDLDVIFSNINFNWGIGISFLSSTSDMYPSVKIAKNGDVGAVKLEAKATLTKFTSDTELDLLLKATPGQYPIYAALGRSAIGGSSGSLIILGALFTL